MQSLIGAHFLNITFLSVLFTSTSAAEVFATVLIPLISMYAPLQLQKLDFNIAVLNLIWLLALYVPHASSFISNQVFVLNLDG